MVSQQLEVGQIAEPALEGVEPLAPEWVATLALYWRATSDEESRLILEMIRSAVFECLPERSVLELLRALRLLGLVEVQILRLILTRFECHVRKGAHQPAQQVGAEILKTLTSIGKARCRNRKNRVATMARFVALRPEVHVKGSAAAGLLGLSDVQGTMR